MIKRERVLFKIAWVLLAITGVAILVFGLIATAWPAPGGQVRRSGIPTVRALPSVAEQRDSEALPR